jgi:hypothetical protein
MDNDSASDFPDPINKPRHLPSELAELAATEEEVAAGLRELAEQGGFELHQFIEELEAVLRQSHQ